MTSGEWLTSRVGGFPLTDVVILVVARQVIEEVPSLAVRLWGTGMETSVSIKVECTIGMSVCLSVCLSYTYIYSHAYTHERKHTDTSSCQHTYKS